MSETFGARLRLRREQQAVTIDAIAAQTKINPTLLRGLERDDLSHWPEGIFRRAYIRAYASAIGLDPDAVAREFLQLHPDSVVVLPAGAAMWPEEVAERSPRRPALRLGRLATVIAAVPAMLRRPRSEPVVARPALRADPDLSAIAALCTRLGRIASSEEVEPVMAEAAALFDAIGLVVWSANARATCLTPVLVQGYANGGRGRLAPVSTQADNAVGSAFRSSSICIVDGDGVTGAVTVPLLGPRRCVGVLALEVPNGAERRESVRALATILAAQLVAAPIRPERPDRQRRAH